MSDGWENIIEYKPNQARPPKKTRVKKIPYNGKGTPAHNGTETSIQAALDIAPVRETIQAKIFTALENAGARGLCDFEIEVKLSLKHQTASAQRRCLVLDQKVTDSGRTRKTKSGRKAKVWIVKGSQSSLLDPAYAAADKATQLEVIKSKLCRKIKCLSETQIVQVWALLKSEGLLE